VLGEKVEANALQKHQRPATVLPLWYVAVISSVRHPSRPSSSPRPAQTAAQYA